MEENETAVQEAEETADAFLNGWEGGAAAGEPANRSETEEAEPIKAQPPAESEEARERKELSPKAEADGADFARIPPSMVPPQTNGVFAEERGGARERKELSPKAEADGADFARIPPSMVPPQTNGVFAEERGGARERKELSSKAEADGADFAPTMEILSWSAKHSGMTPEAYVAHIRTKARQAAGMDEETARREVEREDREAAAAARRAEEEEAAETSAAERRRRADIEEFQQAFPEAVRNLDGIPKEVWDGVRSGQRLTVAYALWKAGQARAEAEAARREAADRAQNARNAARTTGSMRSAGNESRAGDPFLDGFGS